jgi:S-phase kinase-associated protein 1
MDFAFIIMSLDADEADREVALLSQDETPFHIPLVVANQSILIRTVFANDPGESSVLLNVSTDHLKMVIDFMTRHHVHPVPTITKPLVSDELKDNGVGPWDLAFLERVGTDEALRALMQTANYLNLPSLLDLLCAKMATFIKGKSAEEIRQRFGIVDDLTPQEKEDIRNEHAWAMDVEDPEPL